MRRTGRRRAQVEGDSFVFRSWSQSRPEGTVADLVGRQKSKVLRMVLQIEVCRIGRNAPFGGRCGTIFDAISTGFIRAILAERARSL